MPGYHSVLWGPPVSGPTDDVGEFPHIFFPPLGVSHDAITAALRDLEAEPGFGLPGGI